MSKIKVILNDTELLRELMIDEKSTKLLNEVLELESPILDPYLESLYDAANKLKPLSEKEIFMQKILLLGITMIGQFLSCKDIKERLKIKKAGIN